MAPSKRNLLARAVGTRHRLGLLGRFSVLSFLTVAALGFVEAIEHLLADIDAEQRRHRDEHVAFAHQRGEVTQEQRGQQRRTVQAIGIGLGDNDDLAVAQPRNIILAGIATDRDGEIVHFLRGEHAA